MSVLARVIFDWYTTPVELRTIADEMEEFWKACQLGQDKTVAVRIGKNAELCIIVDQDRIERGVR